MEECWLRFAIAAALVFLACGRLLSEAIEYEPKLLLNHQRLRRLQRDRERQTSRWMAFEERIQNAPDSPERGFELALYYAVTRDERRGREAVQWALAHACERRQVALVLDWCAPLLAEAERKKLETASCTSAPLNIAAEFRDALFARVVRDEDAGLGSWKRLLAWLEAGHFEDARALYAACEYLIVAHAVQHTDLRKDAPEFFTALPEEFLLSLKPEWAEQPDWWTHLAALALVAVDPNLPGSQFVQAWAMEDRETISDGPGVAYEFLWADPYLPGVGFENMDPWVYDHLGRLFARSSWDSDACWIAVSHSGVEQQNCAPGWQKSPHSFGHLQLIPMNARCVDIERRKPADQIILWQLQPDETVSYREENVPRSAAADPAGLLHLGSSALGKVCRSRYTENSK